MKKATDPKKSMDDHDESTHVASGTATKYVLIAIDFRMNFKI